MKKLIALVVVLAFAVVLGCEAEKKTTKPGTPKSVPQVQGEKGKAETPAKDEKKEDKKDEKAAKEEVKPAPEANAKDAKKEEPKEPKKEEKGK